MGHGRIIVGGLQMAGLANRKEDNLRSLERLIRAAAARGAQVVMSPEVVVSGFVGGEAERGMAEPIPGPLTGRLGALARELGVALLIGMSELRDGHLHNAMVVIDRGGALQGTMRKVHINRYETAGGWRNGGAFPVWTLTTTTGSLTAGIMICYDREVPESARLLMLQGAEVIFNPLACGCPTADIHRCLLRTRAFENECYLVMVNHAAPAQNGHSMIIDYNGLIRQEAAEGEEILIAELDLDALAEHRRSGIYGPHHRRPELYGPLADPAGQLHPADANLGTIPARSAAAGPGQ
jgi:predicted amidohydrolase